MVGCARFKDLSNRFGNWANERDNPFRRLIFLPYCPFGFYGNIAQLRVFVRDSIFLPAKSHLCQQASRWWRSAWTVKPWFFLSTHHILLCLLFYEVTIYGEMSSYQYRLIRFRYAMNVWCYHNTGLYLIFFFDRKRKYCQNIAVFCNCNTLPLTEE